MGKRNFWIKIMFWLCVLGMVLIGGVCLSQQPKAGPARGPAAEEPKKTEKAAGPEEKPGGKRAEPAAEPAAQPPEPAAPALAVKAVL